ncbi:unnamed protein product [Hymenolepis diminuta]|uniref:Uncharacterized protein n=1 Tax=Hymenolepis diminuta TaxID=6216 RepID=A0A564Y6H0_HYMDI|nr:unnamed protein product [Hymenolepis diminuta]
MSGDEASLPFSHHLHFQPVAGPFWVRLDKSLKDILSICRRYQPERRKTAKKQPITSFSMSSSSEAKEQPSEYGDFRIR